MNVVSDLSQDGDVSGLTRHTLEADVGLKVEQGREKGTLIKYDYYYYYIMKLCGIVFSD